jgi:hypothetical protein
VITTSLDSHGIRSVSHVGEEEENVGNMAAFHLTLPQMCSDSISAGSGSLSDVGNNCESLE